MKSQLVTKDQTAKRVQRSPVVMNRVRGFAGNHTLMRSQSATEKVQRKGSEATQSLEPSEIKEQALQRKASHESSPLTVPPIVHEVLRSPGQPLDAATRSFMEPRFGHDFSQVRVHSDAHAAESAEAVDALAYTVGRDVVFGLGQYQPETTAGTSLLAHELTHVIQQTNEFQPKLVINQPGDQYEQEADRTALAISGCGPSARNGQTGQGLMRQLMRQPAQKPKEDENVTELKTKVGTLVKSQFKGNYKLAFDHYDADKDGSVNAGEIATLLEDADVGGWATRKTLWVPGILKKLDVNKNGKVEWKEFEDGMKKKD